MGVECRSFGEIELIRVEDGADMTTGNVHDADAVLRDDLIDEGRRSPGIGWLRCGAGRASTVLHRELMRSRPMLFGFLFQGLGGRYGCG